MKTLPTSTTSSGDVKNNTIKINKKNTKPEHHILNLIERLHIHSTPVITSRDNKLNITGTQQQQCYLLHSGSVNLYSQESQLILNSEDAPFIFGFSALSNPPQRLSLLPVCTAKISALPLSKACEIVTEENLWEPLAHMMMYVTQRIYEHCTRLSQISSYETVRTLLIELLNETAQVKENTTALNYIQSRCFLSRSGIMRILAELRTGDYINIQNGKLLDIRSLPKRF